MDYRKYDDTLYVRMDKGDEIVRGILDICEKEKICSAVFILYCNQWGEDVYK